MTMLQRMRTTVESHCDAELARARKRLARGDDPREVIDALSHGLVAKLLHRPTRALHDANPAQRDALAALFLA